MSLVLRSISKSYSKKKNGAKALDNISLEIGKGMFGLLGANGAGKSSLLRTIALLQEPDQGSIHFDSLNTLKHPIELKKVLGYLPQEFGVYPRTSAESLLKTFALLKGIDSKKAQKLAIDRVLDLTNLEADRKRYVSTYSGGMKQRFGIAQLLLNDPKLIIVDEPTAGLDPLERTRFLSILRDVAIENTVLFSTHLVDDIQDLCNDLAIINKGNLLEHAPPQQLINELQGNIYAVAMPKEELPLFRQDYQVLSSGFDCNNEMKVRIYHAGEVPKHFKLENPSLEDAYFKVLIRNSNLATNKTHPNS